MNAPAVSFEVAQRFNALRRRYLLTRVGIALSVAVAAALALWIGLAACDYFWEWNATARKAGMVLGITSVTGWLVYRLLVIFTDTRQRRFAGTLESSFEDFGQRIRTVLDTVDGRVEGPTEMLSALGNQTLGRWETCSPARLVPARGLLVGAAAGIGALLLALGLFSFDGQWRTAMLRALGNEVPYTTLSVAPGNKKILEGAPVVVSLQLAGRTNRDVMLRYRFLADETKADDATEDQGEPVIEWVESDLLPAGPEDGKAGDPSLAKFSSSFGKAKDPIEYQFVTSVGTTTLYRIDVQPLIEAKRTEAVVTPPAYTRLKTRTVQDESWYANTQVWLYRGAWQEWGPHDIEMAVPLSPKEVSRKRNAIF